MQRLNKKGDIEFDIILKLVLALIVLIIIIVLVMLFKGKSLSIVDKVKNVLRFG
jgi:hypothetical protein